MKNNCQWERQGWLGRVASIVKSRWLWLFSRFYRSPRRFHRLAPNGSLFSIPGASSGDVIYNMITSKMKSPLHTTAIDTVSENRTKVSLGVTLAGIVTAILCILALLHDTYSTGSGQLEMFIESSSTSGVSGLFTSASALVSGLGDTVILVATSFHQ